MAACRHAAAERAGETSAEGGTGESGAERTGQIGSAFRSRRSQCTLSGNAKNLSGHGRTAHFE